MAAWKVSHELSWQNYSSAGPAIPRNLGLMNKQPTVLGSQASKPERCESVPRTLSPPLQHVQSDSDDMDDMLTRRSLGPENIWNTEDENDFKQVGSPAWDQPPRPCRRTRTHAHTKHAHFIFPRVHFHDHSYNNGPPLSKGGANPKGWMKEAHFVDFLKPLVEGACQVLPGRSPICIFWITTARLSIDGLNFAKENGIIMLSLQARRSHSAAFERGCLWPIKMHADSVSDFTLGSKRKTPRIFEPGEPGDGGSNLEGCTLGDKSWTIWYLRTRLLGPCPTRPK